jgi:hypothetical protein
VGDALARHRGQAAAQGEQHVLVAPHHAFRHPRRAARVEDVAVVGRPGREVPLRGAAGHRLLVVDAPGGPLGIGAVLDDEAVADPAQGVGRGRQPVAEAPLVDHGHEVGVPDEVAELVLDVAVVDVDPHRPDLEDGPQGLDPLDAVQRIDADVVAGLHAGLRQVVGEPVGPLLHLGVGAALPLRHEVLAVAEVVDAVLEEVGEVVLHGDSLPSGENSF